jgi:hypothetical protein
VEVVKGREGLFIGEGVVRIRQEIIGINAVAGVTAVRSPRVIFIRR